MFNPEDFDSENYRICWPTILSIFVFSDDCVDHPVYRGGQSFQFCERFIDKRRGEAPKKVRACPKHGLSKSHDIIVKQHGGTIDAVN